jgi:lipid A 3-O-deacylase
MTTRVLTFALTLGMAGWHWTSECRAEPESPPPAPLVTAHPIYEGTMPGVMGSATPEPACQSLDERDPFHAGSLTFQTLVGSSSKAGVGAHGPAFDYTPFAFRFGYILDTPCGEDYLRGCVEVLVEANYSHIIRPYGTYFTGPNVITRYNFVQSECAIVPYIQCGAGFLFNDVWKTPSAQQALVGENLEFLLRAEVGFRYMITDCFSLDVEGGFQHISNAGLALHNGGINNVGGSVGFTYFYGRAP